MILKMIKSFTLFICINLEMRHYPVLTLNATNE